ncbi:MAG: TIGR01777 family oxidoreductase, partial [Deltaproteobacteria bacterium]|nr:TIGR01777 family oxidoreductase [Deltaproteobacteria bacterium]
RALSRAAKNVDPAIRGTAQFYDWNRARPPEQALLGTQAVIHLAGEPIFAGIHTRSSRRRMRTSRVEGTRNLVEQIDRLPSEHRPTTLICASAVGIYGDQGENEIDERSPIAPPSTASFLAEICSDWETEAARAEASGLRVCSLRIGIVLSRKGGALPRMLTPFRLGLGGPFGSGEHWVPWIHLDDLCSLIEFALENEKMRGPINAVAPEPVRNIELAHTLGRVLHRPAVLPLPPFLLRWILKDLADELLDSRKIRPARAMAAGFQFKFNTLEKALRQEISGAVPALGDGTG